MKLYRGIVKDNENPDQDGRVRVFVHGVHGPDAKDEELPWAEIIQDLSFVGSGVGFTVIPDIDTWVYVVFEDDTFKRPIVIGACIGATDMPEEAKVGYPYNRVMKTKTGHLLEISDEEGNERIKLFHKSGTYFEIDVDGNKTEEIIGDNTETIGGARTTEIGGDDSCTITGKLSIGADGNVTIDGAKILLNGGAEPVLLGNTLVDEFMNHQHPTGVGPSGPPMAPLPPSVKSETVFTG
jgi:uncharacterized protein involved in type VI secretion and phage assembly